MRRMYAVTFTFIHSCLCFHRELEVGIPTQEDRFDILSCHLAKLPHTLTDAAITRCAAVTHGYVAADLVSVCKEAAMAALRRRHSVDSVEAASPLAITEPDIAVALTRTSPSALREVAVDVPKVRSIECCSVVCSGAHDCLELDLFVDCTSF